MGSAWVLFLLLGVSSALIYTDCDAWMGSQGYRVNQYFPHYIHLSQIQIFANSMPQLYFKNYSVVRIQNEGCIAPTVTAAEVAGKLIIPSVHERDGGCTVAQLTRTYNVLNPAGYIYPIYFSQARNWGAFNPYDIPTNDKPVFYVGLSPGASITNFGEDGAWPLQQNNSCQVHLDHESQNSFFQEMHWGGLLQASMYCSITMGILLMLVATFKIATFIFVAGKLELSIVQGVLGLCWLTGFFWFLTYGLFAGPAGLTAIVPYDSFEGTQFMSLGFLFTALVLLGFYFGEIARLTSRPTVPGLDKMKIPAAIFLVIMWGIILAANLTAAADSFSGDLSSLSSNAKEDLFNFFFCWIAVVVPFAVTAVLVWGSLSVVMQMGSATGPVLRMVLVSALAVIFLWTLIFYFSFLHFLPFDTFNDAGYLTEVSYYGIRGIVGSFGINVLGIILCLNFSVSVLKEIEVSKSGTSSTSSSSKSGSSSSSSSSNDPVIEL